MKRVQWAVLWCGLTVAIAAAQAFRCSGSSSAFAATDPVKGFAVVELFTSEGCSSCPPADQLVARIQQEDKDQPVYVLAFHVDYWNRLGWRDQFSDGRYSQRQSQYASWLNLQSVYTPQVVVNGRTEMVGSQESALRSAIHAGLQAASPAALSISGVMKNGDKVGWRYQVQNAGSNQSVVVAVVQRAATTAVKAGENSGRTLSHVQIVRDFVSTPVGAGGNGNGTLSLPPGIGSQDAEIIAFVQDNADGRIVAATRAEIP